MRRIPRKLKASGRKRASQSENRVQGAHAYRSGWRNTRHLAALPVSRRRIDRKLRDHALRIVRHTSYTPISPYCSRLKRYEAQGIISLVRSLVRRAALQAALACAVGPRLPTDDGIYADNRFRGPRGRGN